METDDNTTTRKTKVQMEDGIRNDMKKLKMQDRSKWKLYVERGRTLKD